MDNSKETYNYFKLVHIVVNLVSEVMRDVFKDEWDKRYPTVPWQDTPASKYEFRVRQPPHARGDKIGQRNFQNLMNTSGDRKEWDVTLLCYTLLNSKPISLNPASVVGGAINKLRDARNDVMHIKKSELTDAEFKVKYSRIKADISKLCPLCQPHLNKLKKIKKDRLPPDIIADLKIKIENEKQKQQKEKVQKLVISVCALLAIAFLTWIIYFLCLHFIPPAIPAYFPEHQISPYFLGRSEEIEKSVDAVLSGTRIVVLIGSTGIGKRTVGLMIGRNVKQLWRPFPWFGVCYVPLYGVRDARGMELQILKSFYAEADVTVDNISKKFMKLMTHSIKRRTLVILDGGPQLFVTDKENRWKDLISNVLDLNKNIYIIITALQPIPFVKQSVENIYMKPFAYEESSTLIDQIVPDIKKEIKDTFIKHLAGSPVFLHMFSSVIKIDKNAEEIAQLLRLTTTPGDLCEAVSVFLGIIEPVEEFFVRFMSLFPAKCSVTALKSCNHDIESVLATLKSKSIITESTESEEQSFTLHPIFKMVPLCEREIRYPLESKIRMNYCFNKHYILEATRFADDFVSPSFLKLNFFRISEMEENLRIMLENGPDIDNYKRLADPEVGRKANMAGTHLSFVDSYNVLLNVNLFQKYDGINVYTLKKKFYKMLFEVSPLLTYGVSSSVFSKNVFYRAAVALRLDEDLDLFYRMIYAQGDKGDIYFYKHIYENDECVILIENYVKVVSNEELCESFRDKNVKGVCLLVVGRTLAVYSQMETVSKAVKSLKDVRKGVELIDKATEVFTSLEMPLQTAESLSTKGLVQVAAKKKYAVGKIYYENALESLQSVYSEHPILAASYFNVGFMYFNMGEFNQLLAIKYFNRSYYMYNSTLGLHRRTANAALYLGKAMQGVGKYTESMQILATSYAILEEVIRINADISKANRHSDELRIAKTLHDNALKEAEFEASYYYPVEDWYHIRAAFQAFIIGNNHRGLGNVGLAKLHLNLARQKLSALCNDNENLYTYLTLLKEDVDGYLGYQDPAVVSTFDKLFRHFGLTFVFSFCSSILVLLLTAILVYKYAEQFMFKDLNFINLF